MSRENLPSRVDAHIGRQLRERRHDLSLSQEMLAVSTGLSPKRIEAFETGEERISASTLYALSRVLSVSVAYFFCANTAKA